jgi:hypothetical protein
MNTRFAPASRSIVNSGLSSAFPRFTGDTIPCETLNVSYWHTKQGRPPAVP